MTLEVWLRWEGFRGRGGAERNERHLPSRSRRDLFGRVFILEEGRTFKELVLSQMGTETGREDPGLGYCRENTSPTKERCDEWYNEKDIFIRFTRVF